MKKPSADRGPKLKSPIAQPQTMMTSGVRQLATFEAGLRSPAVVDMHCPGCCSRLRMSGRVGLRELMHLHENPICQASKNPLATQQCKTSRSARPIRDRESSGVARRTALYLFCSYRV